MTTPRLGVIADDYTGGSDVAAALRRAGISTSLAFGVPDDLEPPQTTAVVVALKSRTAPVDKAVADSVASAEWLRDVGCERYYVKYCSTFDSTPAGNIGPITDAVLDLVGAHQTLICPATPEHGRTVYASHLFVGDQLLSESSMATHPLTPMTDSDVRRLLRPQTPHAVDALHLSTLRAGTEAVRGELRRLAGARVRHVVTDAHDEADLDRLAEAASDFSVLTGAAGLAGAMARAWSVAAGQPKEPRRDGPTIVLAGSCSAQTLRQVGLAQKAMPALRLDPTTGDEDELTRQATRFLDEHAQAARLLVFSSASAEERARAAAVGVRTDGAGLERTLAATARAAVDRGARTVIVAGGETSGAVVQALGADIVDVGTEAARGVPWCYTRGAEPIALLLKSGNFGDDHLLVRESA